MKHLDLSYEKLNDLLDECFWAERRYFNAAEDIQITEYKRFLSHESVNRNRFCHKIVERMSQEGIEPSRLDIVKGNSNRDWIEVKAALENSKPKYLIGECMVQDEVVLNLLKDIIDDGWLPVNILEVLVPMEFQMKQSHIELLKLKKKMKKKKQKAKEKKLKKKNSGVIDFKKMNASK
ncbi:DUF2383 domain-containing protein [Dokdonia sp. PRO95]|uniref:DUF2383 domain-containing protein n=1 Tax=unclassified Dokdonia TaxID=2615033 RepID=UPI000555EBA2|nr:DUF2383 domain-containing protein [Dokdonia sp. PRO95]